MAHQPIIDLSERSISLAGIAFGAVLDRININNTRDHHVAGILLIDELRRQGFSLTRPRPLVMVDTDRLPAIDAPARARRMWDGADDLEQTQEMEAPLHLLEGGAE